MPTTTNNTTANRGPCGTVNVDRPPYGLQYCGRCVTCRRMDEDTRQENDRTRRATQEN